MIFQHLKFPSSHRSRCSCISIATLLILAISCLHLINAPSVWGGGPAPGYEIDLNELKKLKGTPPAKMSTSDPRKSTPQQKVSRHLDQPAHSGTSVTYTIKPGDNLYKILMRDFGMSNREAELLIPGIMRANGLSSGTRLPVGQKIVIQKESSSSAQPHQKQSASVRRQKQPPPPVESTTHYEEASAATPKVSPSHKQESSSPLVVPLEVRSVTGTDSNQLVEGLLTALSIPWTPDKVVEGSTGKEQGERFSIKVDRYLEFQNKKYVVAGNSQDPFAYTMLRLLEMGGYTVIRLNIKQGFTDLASHLLTQLDIPFTPGLHRFKAISEKGETRELNGFMATLPHKPVRVFLTDTPLDAVSAEQLTTMEVEAVIAPAP